MTTDSNENNQIEESAKQPAKRKPKADSSAAGKSPARATTRAKNTVSAAEKTTATEPAVTPSRKTATKRAKTKIDSAPQPRLMQKYRDEIRPRLIEEFGYSSMMQAPRITKIVVNVGLGEALTSNRAIETVPGHIAAITGQKPVVTKAKTSIAGFKLREGQSIGVMVTLRGRRMYEFLDRMLFTALPRIRDFRGVKRNAFDGRGNYSLGFREQIVWPEIDYGSVDRVRGFQVVITTTAKTDAEGFRLLELCGMPFARN